MTDPLEMLTAAELAELFKTSESVLSQWRIRGQGPAFVKMGRSVRYPRQEVEEWLDANKKLKLGGRK